MSEPLTAMFGVIAVGLFYVTVPFFLSVYVQYRRPLRVYCPEAGWDAVVRVSAVRAAFSAPTHALPVLQVRACSEWPKRYACAQYCLLTAP